MTKSCEEGARSPKKCVEPVLSVRDLVIDIVHEGRILRIIDAISFDIYSGEVIDLVGPSGCGKSTLLLTVARLRPKTSGHMSICGRDEQEMDGRSWRQSVVYVPQKATLIGGSVSDNLLIPWKFSCRKKVPAPKDDILRAGLDALGLRDVELDRDAKRLSGGQAARIALLRALVLKPPLLLLDEVDAALDDESAALVGAYVRSCAEAGQAFVRVRHRPPDGFATRRVYLAEGHITSARSDGADDSVERKL
ncbi:MAG: ATP-binding cassette domain-containing protein [Olegusella sp.]|mgnify:CR=1 FL=1|jgi:putative ABC transport system ATP-binding protein|nr:ATP-binding cassette domain-containing protein [Olegusella sp.]MCI1934850.1 ATP-binding cassette domain-containing protein [Atopobiaceae bacterium]